MRKLPYPFVPFPTAWLDDPEIGAAELAVLLALVRRAAPGVECYPSHADIAALAGVSERTVPRILDRLRRKGLVTWERRFGSKGQDSSRFRLHFPVEVTDTVAPTDKEGDRHSGTHSGGGDRHSGTGVTDTVADDLDLRDQEEPREASPHSQVIERYHELHLTATGSKPLIDVAGMVSTLLKKVPLAEVLTRLERYYSVDLWFTKDGRSFKQFAAHYDELAGSNGNGRPKPLPVRRCLGCGYQATADFRACPKCGAAEYVDE